EIAEREGGADLAHHRQVLGDLDASIDALIDEAGVILTPTAPVTAPEAAAIAAPAARDGRRHPIVGLLGQATLPFSRRSLASATVCCGWTGGLPVGLQLVGR